MKNILIIESSPMNEQSLSRKLSAQVEKRLKTLHPEAQILRRDLTRTPTPHLNSESLAGIRIKGEYPSEVVKQAAAHSDELIEELLNADTVVIGAPTWNFGIPSALKAWVDHVWRAGKTFNYSAAGPEGLVKNKKVILVVASGAVFSEGPMKSLDFVEPYLRAILGFIGVTDIQTVRIEGIAIPGQFDSALAKAEQAVASLKI